MIKFLKKHKYKFLTLMLSIISIFTLFIGINKTYAYTYDPTTNTITSDNLLDNSSQYQLFENNFNVGIGKTHLDNGVVYTLSLPIEITEVNMYLYRRDIDFTSNETQIGLITNRVITFTSNVTGDFILFLNPSSANASWLNYDYMFNLGSSALPFEPYGIFINKNLYDTLESNYNSLQSQYNTLLNDYNILQSDYVYIQDNYNDLQIEFNQLENDYSILQNNYDALLDDYNELQTNYNNLQSQFNLLQQQYEQTVSEYEYIINQVAPFNPLNIQSTSVIFNNTNIDIPYNSFVIFDYFQIELDLMDFDILNSNDYRHLIQSMNNKLIITLNLEKPIIIDNLEYWCGMRDFYDDCLNLTLLNNENIINEYTYINNEHQDSQGDMAPYYISSGNQQINRLVFEFVLNDYFYNNYQGKIDYMVQNGTYTEGYNNGLNASNQYIDKLKNEIIEDEQYILSLERTINALQEQINSFSSDYNLNNLMWTIASTPFESFKQIWNVEFFGVNISTMITGFITGLIVLWIIKKFFL